MLAECLLGIVQKEGISSLLARLETGNSEGAKTNNKRALWIAMKVISAQTQRYEDAVFAQLARELMAVQA